MKPATMDRTITFLWWTLRVIEAVGVVSAVFFVAIMPADEWRGAVAWCVLGPVYAVSFYRAVRKAHAARDAARDAERRRREDINAKIITALAVQAAIRGTVDEDQPSFALTLSRRDDALAAEILMALAGMTREDKESHA